MTTYALIAKYRGQPAVYIRRADDEGHLSKSGRVAQFLSSYSMARKVVDKEGFMLVKTWADAEMHAAELAEAMTAPAEPLSWTNYATAAHRAKVADGVYYIKRWRVNADGEWEPGRASHHVTQDWVMSFETVDGHVHPVTWWKPEEELRHTLEHAKTSCQHHANARLLLSR